MARTHTDAQPSPLGSFEFDLYEALALEPSATTDDVKKAYRRLALLHHPDRNGGEESAHFLQLKQAYDVLVDDTRRRNYDAFHASKEFSRDRRPLSASEAAWLVDAQKKAWGVKSIDPFAVCILCDSCPCPADGVCFACGMTFCQMCVRKMHCNGKGHPHYPCRDSRQFSEKLAKESREKARERRMLEAPKNVWLMSPEHFRHERDKYKDRCRRCAPSLCHYWAWGQTKYTVHVAVWLASDVCDAELRFDIDEQNRQTLCLAPTGGLPANLPPLLEGRFAHPVSEECQGDAVFYKHMHCMSFALAKVWAYELWGVEWAQGWSLGGRVLNLARLRFSALSCALSLSVCCSFVRKCLQLVSPCLCA